MSGNTPNQEAVLAFYEAGLNCKDFQEASKYIGYMYKQHNPMAEDGPEGFAKYVAYLKTNFPLSHWDIKQVFEDKGFVILHVLKKLQPGNRGEAIVDIFRLENGKVIEHWDVQQAIPDTAANNNSMF